MNFILVAGSLAFILFILAYLRPGRFGTTILTLSAGYVLALMWGDAFTAYKVLSLPFLSWRDTVYGTLILLPGVLALLFSHKQKSLIPRIISAILIALFGVILILPILVATSQGSEPYRILQQYRDIIITAILLLGLADMVFSRLDKAPRHTKH